mmetsp:Transcript_36440/g.75841  ORF Transcript_36440/g.75841 Transcript_36440/m.75841 type:complete len:83 (+) Transcript_36440:309-557(+)
MGIHSGEACVLPLSTPSQSNQEICQSTLGKSSSLVDHTTYNKSGVEIQSAAGGQLSLLANRLDVFIEEKRGSGFRFCHFGSG